MKKFLLACSLMAAVSSAAFAADFETQKRVPDGCIAVVTVANIQTDPGISWMIGSWLTSKRQSPLKELFKLNPPQEMSVAFFPETKEKPMYLLVVVALAKGVVPDKAKLEGLIRKEENAKLETSTYKGTAIVSGAGPKASTDFSAYAVFQNLIVIGSDAGVIQRAIDGPSVSVTPNYLKIASQSPKAKDALLFADNAGAQFAKFLEPREKKWKLTLLLAAEYLQYMGSSFDIADASKVSGSIVFQAADKAHIAEIKEDAEFLGEAFRRKFIAEKIQYFGKVEVSDLTVKLAFQIEGLEPLWKKLFDQGVLDLFSPES
jgi:hypothetical protein